MNRSYILLLFFASSLSLVITGCARKPRKTFKQAVHDGDYTTVRRYLSGEPEVPLEKKNAMLMLAVVEDQVDIAGILIEEGAILSIRDKFFGKSLLHLAAISSSARMANLLIQKGLNVNARDQTGRATPLHVAIRQANTEVAEALLLAGADVEATESLERTPLWTCIAHNRPVILELLISHKVDINRVHPVLNKQPLHFAIEKERRELAAILIGSGADIEDETALKTIEELGWDKLVERINGTGDKGQ